jgi:hypothetical protein
VRTTRVISHLFSVVSTGPPGGAEAISCVGSVVRTSTTNPSPHSGPCNSLLASFFSAKSADQTRLLRYFAACSGSCNLRFNSSIAIFFGSPI